MFSGYAFVCFDAVPCLDGMSFWREYHERVLAVRWGRDEHGWHYGDSGSKFEPFRTKRHFAFVEALDRSNIVFGITCQNDCSPASLRFLSGADRPPPVTAGLTTTPNDGGSSGGSDDSSDDSDEGGGGGINGIDGYVVVHMLDGDEIVLTEQNAIKLFGQHPYSRNHTIHVLAQENDPELGRAGRDFEVRLAGEGSFTYETVESEVLNTESDWRYKIVDKPWREEQEPSWREEVLRHVNVRNAVAAVFGNHRGEVNVLFVI
ncbi:hypothetical protein AAHA92_01611 [Salvia divinorum]|uniref:Uncharacterized protein n=1 Tax=Salvia divinorum TaxID=28513 RepID=A0ABD1IB56_SALDI